jgi:hypothetical protein
MGIAPELKLVVKHTFLELVDDDKVLLARKPTRPRSHTDPAVFMSLDDNDSRDSDSASSGSAAHDLAQMEPNRNVCLPFGMVATPEMTPLIAAYQTGNLHDWDALCLPEAYHLQTMGLHYSWTEACACGEWYMPMECDGSQLVQPMDMPGLSSNTMTCNFDAQRFAIPEETRTTVMLRCLPEVITRSTLLELLNAQGFFGRFDFLYLPIDFKRLKSLGYALVNLVSSSEALRLLKHFNGFDGMCVEWCTPQQGLEAHVERYRNSPVMHDTVPEEWRPLLLSHGVRVPFPLPTQPIKAPKKGKKANS